MNREAGRAARPFPQGSSAPAGRRRARRRAAWDHGRRVWGSSFGCSFHWGPGGIKTPFAAVFVVIPCVLAGRVSSNFRPWHQAIPPMKPTEASATSAPIVARESTDGRLNKAHRPGYCATGSGMIFAGHRMSRKGCRILPSLLAGMLVMTITLQSSCPILCTLTGSCLTGEMPAVPGSKPDCCQKHHDSQAPAKPNSTKSCCCGEGVVLAKAMMPDADGAHGRDCGSVADRARRCRHRLDHGSELASHGYRSHLGQKSPPLLRAELSVYRI